MATANTGILMFYARNLADAFDLGESFMQAGANDVKVQVNATTQDTIQLLVTVERTPPETKNDVVGYCVVDSEWCIEPPINVTNPDHSRPLAYNWLNGVWTTLH